MQDARCSVMGVETAQLSKQYLPRIGKQSCLAGRDSSYTRAKSDDLSAREWWSRRSWFVVLDAKEYGAGREWPKRERRCA